jgi:hypothetical protein
MMPLFHPLLERVAAGPARDELKPSMRCVSREYARYSLFLCRYQKVP